MKSLVTWTAAIVAFTFTSQVTANSIVTPRQAPSISCGETDQLCPGCDGNNLTDATGKYWSISCDWAVDAQLEQTVEGTKSPRICLDACDDAEDCFGVTFASNGTCVIASGDQYGLAYAPGSTNLARVVSATASSGPVLSSTSRTPISLTTTVGASTRIPPVSVTRTMSSATSTSTGMTGQCDLSDEDLCPSCNGQVAVDDNGKAYRVFCDTSIDADGSYSPQQFLSPDGCMQACDSFDFCTGATYYGERGCELAKANPSPRYDEGNTAFLPVEPASTHSPIPPNSSTTNGWNSSLTAPAPGPTVSITPVESVCNASAVTCPQCDGAPVGDSLNASYTVLCGVEPSCLTLDRQEPSTQDQCLVLCDDDATCLAALWFPDSGNCNLCLRGMQNHRVAGDLQFIVFAAAVDEDDGNGISNSTTPSASRSNPTLSSRMPITDLPTPFPPVETAIGPGPVGPVIPATFPSAVPASTLSTAPSYNSTLVLHATSPPVTTFPPVSCPASDDSVYIDPSANNMFAVGCNARFDAANSRYVSASNFEACAASCTGLCDGVQYGYTTRCGLYTDISVVGPANSWTVAARITYPGASVSSTATSANVAAIVSSTSGPSVSMASVTSTHSNTTVSLSSPKTTRAAPAAYSYMS